MAALEIRNCNIVDVISGTVVRDGMLLIDQGMLKYVGVAIETETIKCFDAEGSWVIPGLIDSHVHLCEEPHPEKAISYLHTEADFFSALRVSRNMINALHSGITLVRDCGSYQGRSLLVKQALSAGLITGPKLVTCGRLMTVLNGHAEYLGKVVSSIDEIEEAIKDEIELGSDFIKVANYPVVYPLAFLKKFVDITHSFGKSICCHTGNEESVKLAVDSGFDIIEHAVPYGYEMALKMKNQNTILVPTYYCACATCEDINLSLITNEDLCTIFQPWLQDLRLGLPIAIETGVKIATGTDAGFPPIGFNAIHNEMEKLTEFGASPLQALQAATLIGAQVCGLENHVGSLEKGKVADLVFIHRNPLEDIRATREVKAVFISGKIASGALKRLH